MAVKELIGTIVSDKVTNTRLVAVTARVAHKNYQKVITKTKRYVAHDATVNSQLGDKVTIRETRPISKTKRWLVVNVLEKVLS
jgi:small subunit ribosomal protein S17